MAGPEWQAGSLAEFCDSARVELREADLPRSADIVIPLAEGCRSPLGATSSPWGSNHPHRLGVVVSLEAKMLPSVER